MFAVAVVVVGGGGVFVCVCLFVFSVLFGLFVCLSLRLLVELFSFLLLTLELRSREDEHSIGIRGKTGWVWRNIRSGDGTLSSGFGD